MKVSSAAFAFASGLCVYLNALRGGFVFDDRFAIVDNADVQALHALAHCAMLGNACMRTNSDNGEVHATKRPAIADDGVLACTS